MGRSREAVPRHAVGHVVLGPRARAFHDGSSPLSPEGTTLAHASGWFVTTAIEDAMVTLREILPRDLNRAVFLSSGSEAVELALKMALAASGRGAVVVTDRGCTAISSFSIRSASAPDASFGDATERVPSGSIHEWP